MELDAELLNDFVSEIETLKKEMLLVVESLQKQPNQPEQFKQFGLLIDRIYGTAATFGFKELASYCGTLKKASYNCANANNSRANLRVIAILETCMANLAQMVSSIHNPEAIKKISYTLQLEEKKAKKLEEEIFQFTKKAS